MKHLLILLFLLSLDTVFGQSVKIRKLQDKIVCQSGEVLCGKIVDCDTSNLRLRCYDRSEKVVPWQSIDTIYGISYRTRFIAPALGVASLSFFSTFEYENVKVVAPAIQVKFGKLRRKHWATYWQFTEMPFKGNNILKSAWGFNYYLLRGGYTRDACVYLGWMLEFNSVAKNKNFFNRGLNIGVEKYINKKYRLFCQLSGQKTIMNVHNGKGQTFVVGMRFNTEFQERYRKLNIDRKL